MFVFKPVYDGEPCGVHRSYDGDAEGYTVCDLILVPCDFTHAGPGAFFIGAAGDIDAESVTFLIDGACAECDTRGYPVDFYRRFIELLDDGARRSRLYQLLGFSHHTREPNEFMH